MPVRWNPEFFSLWNELLSLKCKKETDASSADATITKWSRLNHVENIDVEVISSLIKQVHIFQFGFVSDIIMPCQQQAFKALFQLQQHVNQKIQVVCI